MSQAKRKRVSNGTFPLLYGSLSLKWHAMDEVRYSNVNNTQHNIQFHTNNLFFVLSIHVPAKSYFTQHIAFELQPLDPCEMFNFLNNFSEGSECQRTIRIIQFWNDLSLVDDRGVYVDQSEMQIEWIGIEGARERERDSLCRKSIPLLLCLFIGE